MCMRAFACVGLVSHMIIPPRAIRCAQGFAFITPGSAKISLFYFISFPPLMLILNMLQEAAHSLGIGVTTLKKTCRALNIVRWPFRKVQSQQRGVAKRDIKQG